MNNPFTLPTVNSTLAATTTSDRVALQGVGSVVRVNNVGTVEAFIAFGDSTITATAGGAATKASDGSGSVGAGATELFSVPLTITYAAGVTASGTTTLRLSRGEGG